jgi:uncharacterized surface protein with fasciclin (FAS1) repeats
MRYLSSFSFRSLSFLSAFFIALGTVTVSAQTPSPTPTTSPTPTPSPTPTTSPTPKPSPSPAPGNTSNRSASDLLQQASSAGSFTTLEKIVQTAGLTKTLQNRGGRYTIFAPTDAAFAALPAGTLEKLLRPQNRQLLTRILAYHVAPGEYPSNKLKTGGVKTLGGGLAIEVTPQRVIVNDGSVVQADIRASNAVIHAVNRVFLSRELRQEIAALR